MENISMDHHWKWLWFDRYSILMIAKRWHTRKTTYHHHNEHISNDDSFDSKFQFTVPSQYLSRCTFDIFSLHIFDSFIMSITPQKYGLQSIHAIRTPFTSKIFFRLKSIWKCMNRRPNIFYAIGFWNYTEIISFSNHMQNLCLAYNSIDKFEMRISSH